MDLEVVSATSLARTREQHVRAFRVAPGEYRVHSKSAGVWHRVTVRSVDGTVVVTCNPDDRLDGSACRGGVYYRDELGNSSCKHAVAVTKRLLRKRAELRPLLAT